MAENIRFLDVEKFTKNLKPVTSPVYISREEEFHPQGLFSELIFGPVGGSQRRNTFSYINLNCKVIHPTALRIITQLDRKVEKFISNSETYSLDKSGKLIEDEKGVAGITAFIKLFPKIKWRGETKTRNLYIKLLKDSYADGTIFVNKLPVIPPDQRPIFKDIDSGEWNADSLNDIYQTIIKRSELIRSSGKSGTLFDILNYHVQLAINEHNEFIQTKIGHKSGIIRGQLLGKRVEFSARAVITAGPNLDTDQIGIPLMMAINLFKPFLIHVLLYTNLINKEELGKEIKEFTGN